MFTKDGSPVDAAAWLPYSFDGSGSVASMLQCQPAIATPDQLAKMGVVFAVDPVPPPPTPSTVISWITFVGRFTDAEWAGVQKVINAQITAGNGALAKWVTMAAAIGVDMIQAQTKTYRAQLIAASILTQSRADAIFVAP